MERYKKQYLHLKYIFSTNAKNEVSDSVLYKLKIQIRYLRSKELTKLPLTDNLIRNIRWLLIKQLY